MMTNLSLLNKLTIKTIVIMILSVQSTQSYGNLTLTTRISIMNTIKKILIFTTTFIYHFVLHVFFGANAKTQEKSRAGEHAYTYDEINSLPASDDPDSIIRVFKE